MEKERKQIYIIEHLEPEVFDWCLIEYEHISETVGKENLWFTNIIKLSDAQKLEKFGKVFSINASELKIDFSRACVLDPETDELLKPSESSEFDYFIFGGILGDYPPKKRTKKELTQFIPLARIRNIGNKQMSTDNAVYTVKQIMDGINFKDLKFEDKVSIQLDKFEFVDLPYRYNVVDGKPFMSEKIINYLKKNGAFR